MQHFAYFAATALLTFATAIPAAAKPAKADEQNTVILRQALKAVMAPVTNSPAQSNRPQDPDQGDDNASDQAILIVCSKNTPAAQRSAICPEPNSPN